jgi:hypothetical protein
LVDSTIVCKKIYFICYSLTARQDAFISGKFFLPKAAKYQVTNGLVYLGPESFIRLAPVWHSYTRQKEYTRDKHPSLLRYKSCIWLAQVHWDLKLYEWQTV